MSSNASLSKVTLPDAPSEVARPPKEIHPPSSVERTERQPQETTSRRERLYRRLGYDTEGSFVGPMPTEDFLELLPTVPFTRPPMSFTRPASGGIAERRQAFITDCRSLKTALIFNDIPSCPELDPGLSSTISVHSALQGLPSLGGEKPPRLESFIGVFDLDDDPFDDDGAGRTFPFETEAGNGMRGKLASVAGGIWGTQYRVHLYSIAIFGECARLFRWDAAGVIVSQRFDYLKSDALIEFIWRFSCSSDSDRGHDVSVVPVPDAWPTNLASAAILKRLQDPPSTTRDVDPPRHLYFSIAKIPDRYDPSREGNFLVSTSAHRRNRAPTGRSTRPMLAYDLALRRIVFVKQYWRLVENGSEKEGDIYAKLKEKDVRHLPVFGQGNDVRDFKTRTRGLRAGRSWAYRTNTISNLRLYRMSLETVAEPLTAFRNTRELVSVIRDAMTCHDDAFFEAKILHRDVSFGNIMIDPATRQGLLVDWDMSSPVDSRGHPLHGRGRTGTWQYMSANLLQFPKAEHCVADDRESALYVLYWMTLCHTRNNGADLLERRLRMFDEVIPFGDDSPIGGELKLQFLGRVPLHKGLEIEDEQPHLPKLIYQLQCAISYRYTWGDDLEKEAVRAHHRFLQEQRLHLDKRGMFVDMLTAALDNKEWVVDTRSSLAPPVIDAATSTGKKRTSDQADLPAGNQSSRTLKKGKRTTGRGGKRRAEKLT